MMKENFFEYINDNDIIQNNYSSKIDKIISKLFNINILFD